MSQGSCSGHFLQSGDNRESSSLADVTLRVGGVRSHIRAVCKAPCSRRLRRVSYCLRCVPCATHQRGPDERNFLIFCLLVCLRGTSGIHTASHFAESGM